MTIESLFLAMTVANNNMMKTFGDIMHAEGAMLHAELHPVVAHVADLSIRLAVLEAVGPLCGPSTRRPLRSGLHQDRGGPADQGCR